MIRVQFCCNCCNLVVFNKMLRSEVESVCGCGLLIFGFCLLFFESGNTVVCVQWC